MTRILIMTVPGDVHAYAVREALRRKGADATLWMTTDFPLQSRETIAFHDGRSRIRLSGPNLDTGDAFDVVWHRRPSIHVDATRVHPADEEFVRESCKRFREALYLLLARDAFWVNGREAALRAMHKPLQHAIAVECGLELPASVYSNDPEVIRAFARGHGGTIISKAFKTWIWTDGTKQWSPSTALVSEAGLADDAVLELTPAIYQELVPKAYELRVTVIGRRAFTMRLDSQSSERGRIDWRLDQSRMQHAPAELPPAIEAKCHALMERLGLVFGCIDLIVTPDGRYVFLEVNEMGQWLFAEDWTGQPLLDAFAEMLLQARADFTWSPAGPHVHYAEVKPLLGVTHCEVLRDHVEPIVEWRKEGDRAPQASA